MTDDEIVLAVARALEPRCDLWPSTAARIARERRRRTRARWLAVAATVVALIGASALLRRQTPAPRPIANMVVQRAEQDYLDAFARLRNEQRASRASVDERSVAAIDAAIASARAEVVAAPDDPRAVARWRAACDRKVDVLRAAVESRL